MHDRPDLELVRQLQQGQNRALNVLMDRYQDRLYAFIIRYIRDHSLADEIFQETFARVYFKAAQFNPRYAFGTWLFRIALNLCRDHHRVRSGPVMESLEAAYDLPAESESPEGAIIQTQEVARLTAAIDGLPHRLKAPFILFVLEERSQQDCAEILRVSRKTVETRVYRARKLLLKLLKPAEG